MANALNYVLGLLLLIFCVHQSSAINCYECNSHNNTRCASDKVPDDLKKTCPNKDAQGHDIILCRKIKQVIDFEVNGLQPDSRVIRTCGWDDSSYKNRCYQRSGFGGRQEVCACEEDYCNGSNMASASVLIATVLLAALKITL